MTLSGLVQDVVIPKFEYDKQALWEADRSSAGENIQPFQIV